MKTYGYCRISTKQQNIERQIRNIIREYPDAKIVEEAYTGTTTDRPKWKELYKRLKKGDTVVFDSVSRMSRNAEDGFKLYEMMFNRGIELVFLKEPHINSETYKKAMQNNIEMTGTSVDCILKGINEYLMALAKEQIKLAFEQAQKEVDDLRQRTREGIQTARENGKQIGQVKGSQLNVKKKEPIKKRIKELSRDFDGSNTDAEVMQIVKVARNTYYKYKKELQLES